MKILFISLIFLTISCNNEVSQNETSLKEKSIDSTIQKRSTEDPQYHFLKEDLFIDDSGNIV